MALRWVIALLCVPACLAHIRLTWPQARYPQLDFLDNVRTGLPCGVPFDNNRRVVTTLTAGSRIQLQWHLGFAHRGGVTATLLTPTASYNLITGYARADNPTLLSYWVTLPQGVTCSATNTSDCILQIRHQALEWGSNYIFHSCADLQIVAQQTSASACASRNGQNCSGNGECVNNQCVCNRLASGTFCQNVDECVDNSDCGGNTKGVCQNTGATSYPKKQCYCRAGWMGPLCAKASSLDNALIPETGYYDNKMKISDSYYLYWKVNTQVQPNEIEVAMKVRTTSWVGLGWRPTALTVAACHAVPGPRTTARGTSTRRCRPASEPEPEGTAAPEGEPESQPEGEPETTAEPSATLPVCDANGNPPTAEPEATQEAEPEATGEAAPEPTTAAAAEPEATAEGGAEPTSESEPEGEPEAGGDMHLMDCRDVVIGMAKGCSFRMMDGYARDRSTPKTDSFFGGEDNLKGAVGMEQNGWTYLKFMRNMVTGSKFDHPFTTASPMNMIWAHGQRQGAYTFNVQPSGVMEANASDKAFYKDDELKYHGFTNNRGAMTVDLNSRPAPATTAKPANLISYSQPDNCQGTACVYKVVGNLDTAKRNVEITLTWNDASKWVALGTSGNRAMPNTDMTLAQVVGSSIQVTDRFATARALPPVDTDQTQVTVISSSVTGGLNTVTFRRPCETPATDTQDISFPSSYLVYGFGPLSGSTVVYHQQTPVVAQNVLSVVCAGASAPEGEPEAEATAEPEAPATTPQAEGEPEGAPEGEPEGQPPATAATQAPVVEQVLGSNTCYGRDFSGSGAGQLAASMLLVAVALFLAL